ncbi:PolC-type DNA polymerase III N-terminal domain-containing protein [Mammaliicoccus sciuri]
MTGQEKFQTLLTQMNITDELDKDVVEQGELTRIDVSQSKRLWHFYIKLPYFLSSEMYLVFTNQLKNAFSSIAQVDWTIEVTTKEQIDEHILKYIPHCIDGTELSDKVKHQLKQKPIIFADDIVKVQVNNDIERDYFDKRVNGSLVKALQKCGFQISRVIFETMDNEEQMRRELESFEAHIQQEDEEAARIASEKMERMKKKKQNLVIMKMLYHDVKLVKTFQ